ncbi:hypothetical protein DJ564_17835 [Pseudomonas sp. 31-12]|uniref:hypothetical protein n=1 Tax=Pseudomonas sp. 31-12 TaxID=2201356 RepID=UPI000D6B94EF|nr:hypothetical protein [Pseudomonas sp. 31-12]AWM92538.1 hypothetical protein DJ564_17835 [Pseudomonas sp. 31-12]
MITFQQLLAMKWSSEQLKIYIENTLTAEQIIELNNQGVEHLKSLKSDMGCHQQLGLLDPKDDI